MTTSPPLLSLPLRSAASDTSPNARWTASNMLTFDGDSAGFEPMSMVTVSRIKYTDTFTLSWWLKLAPGPGPGQPNSGSIVQIYSGNWLALPLFVERQDSSIVLRQTTNTLVAASVDHNWHHLALTQGPSGLIVYVDGRPTNLPGSVKIAGCDCLGLGFSGASGSFRGRMAQVQFHGRVLAADEILQLMAEPPLGAVAAPMTPAPAEVVAAPMAPIPAEVVAAPMPPAPSAPVSDGITVHASRRFCAMKVSQAEYDGWGGRDNESPERASALTRRLYARFKDDFDFIVFVRDVANGGAGMVTRIGVSNAVQGIGAPVYDRTALHGSSGRLKAHLSYRSRRSLLVAPFLRNICSQWANYAIHTESVRTPPNVSAPIGRGTDTRAWGFSGCGGQLGGFDPSTLVDNVDGVPGKYQAHMPGRTSFGSWDNGPANCPYSNLELYMMGMIPDAELTPFDVFTGLSIDPVDMPGPGNWNGKFHAAVRTTFDRDGLLELLGPRTPAAAGPVELRVLVCVLTTADALDPAAAADIDTILRRLSLRGSDTQKTYYNFWEATGGRGWLSLDLSGSLR